jgi:hypothetical protein
LLTTQRDRDAPGMQRLYLASHHFDSLPSFLGADPCGLRVGFVPTAMGVLEDRSSLEKDLGALDAMGFAVEQIELQGMSSRELATGSRVATSSSSPAAIPTICCSMPS